MATEVLVEFTPDAAESEVITVLNGQTHHVLPVFGEDKGKVTIGIIQPDGVYRAITTVTIPSRHPNRWILEGPLQYIVGVRNAGADVEISP